MVRLAVAGFSGHVTQGTASFNMSVVRGHHNAGLLGCCAQQTDGETGDAGQSDQTSVAETEAGQARNQAVKCGRKCQIVQTGSGQAICPIPALERVTSLDETSKFLVLSACNGTAAQKGYRFATAEA